MVSPVKGKGPFSPRNCLITHRSVAHFVPVRDTGALGHVHGHLLVGTRRHLYFEALLFVRTESWVRTALLWRRGLAGAVLLLVHSGSTCARSGAGAWSRARGTRGPAGARPSLRGRKLVLPPGPRTCGHLPGRRGKTRPSSCWADGCAWRESRTVRRRISRLGTARGMISGPRPALRLP